MKADGFSIVEALIAMGVALSVIASALTLVGAVQIGFSSEGERADLRQRVRVASDALYRDLLMAGAGSSQGRRAGHYTRAP